MFNAYGNFWKKYVDFRGKSSRSDFWYVYLVNVIVSAILSIVDSSFNLPVIASAAVSGQLIELGLLTVLYSLAIIIPTISLMIRRLRDGGLHWAFIFLAFIPFVGPIIILVLMLMPTSDKSSNK